jgi:hypothetical protein
MATKEFALAPGEPRRVALRWKGAWKDFTVQLDGAEIAKTPELTGKKLVAALPDGRALEVSRERVGSFPALRVAAGGRPLPGSDFDPPVLARTAATAVWIVGVLSIAFGVVLWAAEPRAGLAQAAMPAVGALMCVLAWFVHKRRSRPALGIAFALFILDTVVAAILAFTGAFGPGIVGAIVVRVVLIRAMWGGFDALDTADDIERRAREPAPPPPAPGAEPPVVKSKLIPKF